MRRTRLEKKVCLFKEMTYRCSDSCFSVSEVTSSCLPRVTEYVSSLEHSHFSDGSSQPPLTITQAQQAAEPSLELGAQHSPEHELPLGHPVIQPLSIQELLKGAGRGKGLDLRGGSLLSGTGATKAVCALSTQADR